MNKKILILVSLIAVFGFGSATALIIPVGFDTPTTVELYTKNITVPGTTQFVDINCDPGDVAINAYIILEDPVQLNTESKWAINNGEGFRFEYSLDSALFNIVVQIVCAKEFTFPMNMGMIGGELLEINTVSLLVGAIGVNPVITGLVGITLAGITGQAVWFVHRRKKNSS